MLRYIGLRVPALYQLSLWMPVNFFGMVNGVHVNTQECLTVWDTAAGWLRCLVSGGAGMVLFLAAGWIGLRRKDLS